MTAAALARAVNRALVQVEAAEDAVLTASRAYAAARARRTLDLPRYITAFAAYDHAAVVLARAEDRRSRLAKARDAAKAREDREAERRARAQLVPRAFDLFVEIGRAGL